MRKISQSTGTGDSDMTLETEIYREHIGQRLQDKESNGKDQE